ncbi:MAG: hypothetical protein LBQ66_12225 [Planctomycetaceae bacterium]|jgi:hypothetical protein|nr:hypothetical protein [Planctomycetaceae bacterium]
MTRLISCCVLLVLIVLSGCGSNNVGVSGKVIFSDDGSPLTCGVVHFATDTFQATGTIKEDGTFVMGSFGERDGLPVGTYQVSILGASELLPAEKLEDEKVYSFIDPKWESPLTSDLTITIDKSTSNIVIKVDRNPITKEQFLLQ